MKTTTREIGASQPVLIIAEMSGNHNGELARALALVDAAADAGADAVKLQTYSPEGITLNSERPEFVVDWQGSRRTLWELYSEGQTPREWHSEIFSRARARQLLCFSAPFDVTAVDFLESLDNPVYKVASFEVVDVPLLERIGQTGKPVIISRGMSSLEELELALSTLRSAGAGDIAILQCTSAYPAAPDEMHLKNIPDLRARFRVDVGLSDHSLQNDAAVAAVALGAVIVEKHLTLARAEGGIDSSFSLEPAEFKTLVKSIRTVEAALGPEPFYGRTAAEEKELKSRKSLFAAQDIRKGERLTPHNVRSVRPAAGLSPRYYHEVLGKRATCDIPFATPLSWEMIGDS
jgi:N-acetylneuraminate synthase